MNSDFQKFRFATELSHQIWRAFDGLVTFYGLRVCVAGALAKGEPIQTLAKRFGVSVASALRSGQCQCAGRGQTPGKIGGHRRKFLAGEAGE
jgi:hypothetical protein